MVTCCRNSILKVHKLIRILFVVVIFVLIFVYTVIFEPYCFFKSWENANNISGFINSEIETYGSQNVSSNKKDIIVMLIPRVSSKLIYRLELLDSNFDDNFTTDILFLHTNDLFTTDLVRLTKTMKRKVLFLNVAEVFNVFPIGFDPCQTSTSYRVRGKWNYMLMIRFWFKTIFELPQLENYDYIMRLDDDSKIMGKWINVFDEMRRTNAVYFANNIDIDLEDQLPGTMKMQEFTHAHVKKYNIKPKQLNMLDKAFFNKTVLNYYNNFEVSKVIFFRSDAVLHFTRAIDSTYGIFKYRWGDAVLRYLTLALFAEQHDVLHRTDYNLSYCHKCP